jgi:triosephosphate isomerase
LKSNFKAFHEIYRKIFATLSPLPIKSLPREMEGNTMRKPLIAGNWKMHGSLSQVSTLVESIKSGTKNITEIEILLLPSFVHLAQVRDLLMNSAIQLGAQNLYLGAQGAFTGEVSGVMLKEIGCKYVLIGHSERRAIFGETLEIVAQKFKAAQAANLIPILCVGETRAEREKNDTEKVIRTQIEAVTHLVGIEALRQAVIAYEPVWAIGTGLTATPEQAQAVHTFIRHLILQNNVDIAKTIRILYGGSMKPENAAALLAKPDIDGGLIGGASLDADQFLTIRHAAQSKVSMSA